MQDMSELLRKAQEMQSRMAQIQEELGKRIVTARSGGGMVTVVCNGKQEIQSIGIEKALLDPNEAEMLQDLLLAAVNEALRLSQELARQELSTLSGGFQIPGLL